LPLSQNLAYHFTLILMEAKKIHFLKIVGVGPIGCKAKAEAGGRLYFSNYDTSMHSCRLLLLVAVSCLKCTKARVCMLMMLSRSEKKKTKKKKKKQMINCKEDK
jgi:hypothetical protein